MGSCTSKLVMSIVYGDSNHWHDVHKHLWRICHTVFLLSISFQRIWSQLHQCKKTIQFTNVFKYNFAGGMSMDNINSNIGNVLIRWVTEKQVQECNGICVMSLEALT